MSLAFTTIEARQREPRVVSGLSRTEHGPWANVGIYGKRVQGQTLVIVSQAWGWRSATTASSLEHIIEDNRRASDVIVRMRDFLRKEDGLPEAIDLNGIVAGVARLVSSDAIFRNVALVLQLDSDPAVVRGDRVQLQQVVLNLIVNALEAFGDGSSSDRRIFVRSRRLGQEFVEISVDDNGCGFSRSPDGAFEAFYSTKPGGIGLGLSIARSIVDAHAGDIRAANNAEGGATISFRLPLAQQDAA